MMMMKEGVGRVPPSPVTVILTEQDVRLLAEAAKLREAERQYGARPDSWGKGLTSSIEVPGVGSLPPKLAAIVIGMLGEHATAFLLNRRVRGSEINIDLDVYNRGDGGVDLSPFGFSMDVKTRREDSPGANEKINLVRCRRADGTLITSPCRAFVFCEWKPPKKILVLGWILSRKVDKDFEEIRGRKGRHWNKEIPDHCLSPISSLIDELKARDGAH